MRACFSEVASELKRRRRYLVTVKDVVAGQCSAWFIFERDCSNLLVDLRKHFHINGADIRSVYRMRNSFSVNGIGQEIKH